MTAYQKALVLGGKTGLVGQALVSVLRSAGWQVSALGRDDVDLTGKEAAAELGSIMDREDPSCVFNAAAFTNVDGAEEDQENATLLNRTLPAMLARLLKPRPCTLVHFSTDFVFDGKKKTPYTPEDPTAPLSVYGKTKLAGEEAILGMELQKYLIIRSSWIFGPGRYNFINFILEKCRQKQELRIVHDQVGSPTYSLDLAQYTLKLVESGVSGLFHVANAGQASKCELADEAVDLSQFECVVNPIPSSHFPQKAVRPAYSALDCRDLTRVTGITPRPWPQALREYIYKEFSTE